jgi:MFS family permease
MLQGAAGALLTPQVLAILGSTYVGAQRAKAFAAFGFAMGIAGVLGQLIGGALIQADLLGLGWRTIFLINLPVGLLTVPLVHRVVPESRGPRARLDLIGAVLGTATIAALVLPLVEGREHHWPVWTWISLASVPVLGSAFLISQRRRRAPLVELSLFRVRSFAAGTAAATTFGLVPPAFFFVLALYLQFGRGYDPLFSGTVFAVVGIGYFTAMFGAEALARRLGRQVLALGALLVAAGCGALAIAADASSALDLAPGLALVGFGIGAVLVPMSSMALAGLDPAHAGSAAGVLATGQQIGAATGVAVVGTVFFALAPIPHAFVVSLAVIAGLTLATAALAQLLPN